MDIKKKDAAVPARSEYIAWTEFIEISGVHPTRLGELIELAWIEPKIISENEYLFRVKDVYRIRKLERLCHDFELSCVGGTLVVDLLTRIQYLENKIAELERLLGA